MSSVKKKRSKKKKESKAVEPPEPAPPQVFSQLAQFYVRNLPLFYTRFYPRFIARLTGGYSKVDKRLAELLAGLKQLGTVDPTVIKAIRHLPQALPSQAQQSSRTAIASSSQKPASTDSKLVAAPAADTFFLRAAKFLLTRAYLLVAGPAADQKQQPLFNVNLTELSDKLDDGTFFLKYKNNQRG